MLDDHDNPLAALLNRVLRFVDRSMRQIMECADRISLKARPHASEEMLSSSSPGKIEEEDDGFEIMANVIWDEVGRALMDDLGNVVFAVGRPDEFRKVRGQ